MCPEDEELLNRIDLMMISMGTDFETHGGKRVRWKGFHDLPMGIPLGTTGTIDCVLSGGQTIVVRWDLPTGPIYMHGWDELETIEENP